MKPDEFEEKLKTALLNQDISEKTTEIARKLADAIAEILPDLVDLVKMTAEYDEETEE